jgi:hypothetical protein
MAQFQMQFRAGHGMPCPYMSETNTVGETPALRKQRQRLPGPASRDRPLQREHQQRQQSQKQRQRLAVGRPPLQIRRQRRNPRQRQRRPPEGGRYKFNTTVNCKKPARRRRYEVKIKPAFSVAQQVAGDYQALHFAGAFVNCEDAGVAIVALDVGFARIAAAAVDLDRFVGYAVSHFAGV